MNRTLTLPLYLVILLVVGSSRVEGWLAGTSPPWRRSNTISSCREESRLAVSSSTDEKDSSIEEESFSWENLTSKSSTTGDPLSSEQAQDRILGPEGSDDKADNVHIPSAGISVFDEMDRAHRDRFVSDVVPLSNQPGVAQITSSPMVRQSFEPLRYLVALAPPQLVSPEDVEEDASDNEKAAKKEPVFCNTTFAMVDVPPYTPQLAAQMREYMGINHTLATILVTSRDGIHYDEAQAVFSKRRSDLQFWKQAFPSATVVAYRMDVPRDCQAFVTQRLDGYGPFAAAVPTDDDAANHNLTFVETGRPLTYNAWDFQTSQDVMNGGKPPPDDDDANKSANMDDADQYTLEAIRAREEGQSILAVYTPGHSYGSVSYVFPQMKVCCSGFTIPVEDTRLDANEGFVDTGPALDVRGYITTSRAGIKRQMESARALVTQYVDRFCAVLPSRGIPLLLGGSDSERKEDLLDMIGQYERLDKSTKVSALLLRTKKQKKMNSCRGSVIIAFLLVSIFQQCRCANLAHKVATLCQLSYEIMHGVFARQF